MSKRRGDVVFLDELLDEIGVDAARWYLANRGPDQTIEIDIDLAAERTEKNPSTTSSTRTPGSRASAGTRPMPRSRRRARRRRAEERDLIKRLAELPDVVREAAERRGPQGVPNYAIRVADDFHRFYHHHRVLDSDAQAFRLGLCAATQAVIARCLDLIGVEAPDRM